MKTMQELYFEWAQNKCPGMLPEAVAQFTTVASSQESFMAGAAAMAALFAAQPVQLRGPPGAGGSDWTPRGGDQGAFDTQNMGPFDPRSFNRRCIHGKLPTEDCQLCEESSPGVDGTGSPVA